MTCSRSNLSFVVCAAFFVVFFAAFFAVLFLAAVILGSLVVCAVVDRAGSTARIFLRPLASRPDRCAQWHVRCGASADRLSRRQKRFLLHGFHGNTSA